LLTPLKCLVKKIFQIPLVKINGLFCEYR
jgi:hypothetical protein